MDESLLPEIRRRIRAAQRTLIVSHIRPDGDAIGSVLGLGLALLDAGKEVEMVLADGLPADFRHLPGSERVITHPKMKADLAVVLDSSDIERVGDGLGSYGKPDINIDHHITNLNFAEINYVDVNAAATTQILAEILPQVDLQISQQVASVLLAGIITDTIGFRTSNMTAQVLRTAATLMELGADLSDLYYKSLVERSFEAARLWGAGLSRLERDAGLAWTTLTLQDKLTAKYPGRDDADLVNVLSSIRDAAISVIFIEQQKGKVKVSWRSQLGHDVAQIALYFGGGGHPAAAGAELEGSLQEVQEKVLSATRAVLNGDRI